MQIPIAIEQADSGLIFDKQGDWSGGVNNFAHPTALAANEFTDGRNVEARRPKRLDIRRGSLLWGSSNALTSQALDYFVTPTVGPYLIQIAGGQLYYRAHAGAWTLQAGMTLTNTTTRVETRFLTSKTYIFSGNAADHVWSWDGTTLVDLGDPTSNTKPPQTLITCVTADRMWAAKGNLVYYSNNLAVDTWNQATQNMSCGAVAESIIGILALPLRKILVVKETTAWVIDASDISTAKWFSYQIAPVGGVSHKAMALVGNSGFWLSPKGVYEAGEQQYTSRVIYSESAITTNIQVYMDRIDLTAGFDAVSYDDYFLLAYSRVTGEREVLVWDQRIKVWVGYWDNWNNAYWTQGKTNNALRLFFVTSAGQVNEALTGENDNNVYPTVTARTRGLDWKEDSADELEKSLVNFVMDYISGYGTTNIRIYNSKGTSFLIATYSAVASSLWGTLTWPITWAASSLADRAKIIPRRNSRWWQIELMHTGGVVGVQRMGLSAFPRAFRLTSLP